MREGRCWIGTSWKMNKTLGEALAFATEVGAAKIVADPALQPFVIPPFTAIREVKRRLAGTPVKVGAQNMHWAEAGAWTGEISPGMLVDCGAELVELGHSERRAHFGETDETVGRKVAAAVRHSLVPLICVGETLAEREAGRADEVLARQVRGALAQLPQGADAPLLFAYEPVWAIGEGGSPASPEYAGDRQARIRELAGALLQQAPPVLYGGSVTADNCLELIAHRAIDGLFIGRAAWQPQGYLDILERCAATRRRMD